MRITAAVPCYNGEKFIAGCIQSLLEQSQPPDEILVVDDGSTDSSAEILARFDQVRVITLDRIWALRMGETFF